MNTSSYTINPHIISEIKRTHEKVNITNHPLINRIVSSTPSMDANTIIARNFYHVTEHFPRFISAVITNMTNSYERMPLVENLFEEHGRMDPSKMHIKTYSQFLEEAGISVNRIKMDTPCLGVTTFIRAMIDTCLHYPYLEGLAAIGILEDMVQKISPIIGLHAKETFSDISKISHFDTHAEIDIQHSHEIYALLKFNSDEEIASVHRGLELGAYYYNRLFNDILQDVMDSEAISIEEQKLATTS